MLVGTRDQVAGGVVVVDSAERARLVLGILLDAPGPCGIDCETVDVDPGSQSPVGNGRIVCWSVAWLDPSLGHHSWAKVGLAQRAYIPVEYLEYFRPWLESKTHRKVGHNIWRFDRHIFYNHGIDLGGIVGDTLRMSQMLYNVKGYDHGLKALARRYLGYEMRDYDDLFSRPKPGKVKSYKRVSFRMPGKTSVVQLRSWFGGECQAIQWGSKELIPLDELARDYPSRLETLVDYASLDAKATLELYYVLAAALARLPARGQDSEQLYGSFWNPVCRVVSNEERRGILLDAEVCDAGLKRALTDIAAYEEKLAVWVEPGFNWNAPAQLKELCYDRLGMDLAPIKGTINAIKATDFGERSMAEASLYWLELNARSDDERAMLGTIRKRRKAVRIAGYLRDLPSFRGPDGRIHASMGPDTRTGRLAAKVPPLQQMPSKRDIYGVRRAFVAAPGHVLIVADYSQLEVYVLAHMLRRLFNDDSIAQGLATGDVYGNIAKLCWPNKTAGVEATAIKHHPDKEVQKLRDLAKIVVLATNYGKTPQGLAISLLDEYGVSVGLEYAVNLLATYEAAFPGVVKFQHWTSDFASKHGGIYTLAGRWRPIPEARSEVASERRRGNRIASNTPIQGSAMDIVAEAMIAIDEDVELQRMGAQQLLQIHDEIVVEVPQQYADEAQARVDMHMVAQRYDMLVGLKVEIKQALNWAEGK